MPDLLRAGPRLRNAEQQTVGQNVPRDTSMDNAYPFQDLPTYDSFTLSPPIFRKPIWINRTTIRVKRQERLLVAHWTRTGRQTEDTRTEGHNLELAPVRRYTDPMMICTEIICSHSQRRSRCRVFSSQAYRERTVLPRVTPTASYDKYTHVCKDSPRKRGLVTLGTHRKSPRSFPRASLPLGYGAQNLGAAHSNPQT